MFSYRHAFHAGNHADVLKHLVLIHSIRYLQEKDGGLMLIDTHAGAGLYALREGYATVSQEALTGIDRIIGNQDPQTYYSELQAYIDLVNGINPPDRINFYPGSPFILAKLLRAQDRARVLLEEPRDFRRVDTRYRNKRTNAIHDQGTDQEKQARAHLAETRRVGDGCCRISYSRCHFVVYPLPSPYCLRLRCGRLPLRSPPSHPS